MTMEDVLQASKWNYSGKPYSHLQWDTIQLHGGTPVSAEAVFQAVGLSEAQLSLVYTDGVCKMSDHEKWSALAKMVNKTIHWRRRASNGCDGYHACTYKPDGTRVVVAELRDATQDTTTK